MYPFRRPLLVPLAVFGIAVLGVPVVEVFHGNVPGAEALEGAALEEFLDGRLARRIENGFAERSVAAAAVRPRYQEALWILLRRTTPKVVVGKDGWLFEASNVLGGPRRDAGAAVQDHAQLIGELARWLERRGTQLLAVPVPNKWSVHPEKLPDLPEPPRSVWRDLVTGLVAEGVWTADLAGALDPARGSAFLPNDTHWSEEGCAAAAAAVAREVRARFGLETPGVPVDAFLDPVPGQVHRGDLQRMLGFAEGSAADRSFLARTTKLVARERRSGARLEAPPPGQDVVACGTSFSRSMEFPAKLAAALGRQVENRTVAGRGPTVMLLELAEAVKDGRRPPPRLVVWEFPEKHLFGRRAEFLEPLRSFVERCRAADAWTARTWSPLPVASREAVNLRLEAAGDGSVRGTPTSGDPQIIVHPGAPLRTGAGLVLGYTVRTGRPTTTKVLFDFGGGFDRAHAVVVPVGGGGEARKVLVPVAGPADAEIRRFRLDPVDAAEAFELGPLQLSSG